MDKLQEDLDRLYDWTHYSLLKFHPDKCEIMRLSSTKSNKFKNIQGNYIMDETTLNKVDKEKDLGIIFDTELSFEEHINTKVKKANSLVGMIRRTFVYLDKDMFKQLFTSIIRPHVEYGAPVWNPYSKKLSTLIENVQRRASKQIPGLSHLSYEERLRTMKLPTLKYRRYRGDMIELYKMTHDLYDKNAIRKFLDFRSSHSRGHQFNLFKHSFKKDVRKYSFKWWTTAQWNNLPDSIVYAPSMKKYIYIFIWFNYSFHVVIMSYPRIYWFA